MTDYLDRLDKAKTLVSKSEYLASGKKNPEINKGQRLERIYHKLKEADAILFELYETEAEVQRKGERGAPGSPDATEAARRK